MIFKFYDSEPGIVVSGLNEVYGRLESYTVNNLIGTKEDLKEKINKMLGEEYVPLTNDSITLESKEKDGVIRAHIATAQFNREKPFSYRTEFDAKNDLTDDQKVEGTSIRRLIPVSLFLCVKYNWSKAFDKLYQVLSEESLTKLREDYEELVKFYSPDRFTDVITKAETLMMYYEGCLDTVKEPTIADGEQAVEIEEPIYVDAVSKPKGKSLIKALEE